MMLIGWQIKASLEECIIIFQNLIMFYASEQMFLASECYLVTKRMVCSLCL